MEKINDKVRFMRELKQWTQEEMAEKLNMSIDGYAKLERGLRRFDIPKLERVAAVLGVDLLELLSVNDKSVVCVITEQSYNNHNNNYGDENLSLKIEKLELQLEHAQELLRQKEKEIVLLRQLLEK